LQLRGAWVRFPICARGRLGEEAAVIFQGSGELALEAEFGVGEEAEGRGSSLAEGFVGKGEAGRFGKRRVARAVHAIHFDVDGGVLRGPKAADAPMGEDHLLDEADFDGVRGVEAFDVSAEEVVVDFAAFVGEDVVVGEDAVDGGVLRGDGFAAGGFGAFGEGSVAAGGFAAGFGDGWAVGLRHGWLSFCGFSRDGGEGGARRRSYF
jgi:hypothetical protein